MVIPIPLTKKSFKIYKAALLASPFFFILYLLRFNLGPLPTNVLEIYTLAMVAWYLVGLTAWSFPKPTLGRNSTAIITGFFLLAASIATVTTVIDLPQEYILVPLGIWKGWFIAPAALYLLLITAFRSEQDVRNLIDVYIGALALVALVMLVQYVTGIFPGPKYTYDLRLVWPYLDPWTLEGASANYPALFLSPALMLAVFSQAEKKGMDTIYYWLSILVLAGAIFLTRSYGAYLSALVAIGLMLFHQGKTAKRWLVIPAVLIILTSIVATQWNTEKFQWFLKLGRDSSTQIESSTSERVNIYKVSMAMLKTNPIKGIGVGQYQRQFEQVAPEVLGRPVTRKEINHALHPHNTYLMFWLSGGVLLLVTFILLVASWMTGLPQIWKFLLSAPLAYLLVHGMIDVFYWKNDLAFSFWFLGAIMVIVKNTSVIYGTVVQGLKVGRTIGIPTANLQVDAPPNLGHGVYLVSISLSGHKYRGLLYYGPRKTEGLPESMVCEVTLLDYEGDLYGQKLKLRIHKKLREDMSFSSRDDLKLQIEKDILMGRNLKI